MKKHVLKFIPILVIVSLLMPVPLAFAERPGPNDVQTATDEALEKIHPALREQAQDGGAEQVMVSVHVAEGTDLSAYMDHIIMTRPFDGEQVIKGVASVGSLTKIAGTSGVIVLLPVGRYVEPPQPPDPDVGRKPASLEDALPRLQAEETGPMGPTDWHDVLDVHQSKAAWDKGYDGDGVWVGVLDDSVDFGHPDLQGTWAVYPTSAVSIPVTYTQRYGGWPVAFSPVSLLGYIYESNFAAYGYLDVSTGLTWYADTSYTATVASGPVTATADFTPLTPYTPTAHTYTFSNTSQSGVYHFGSHPDDNLQATYGERVAVVVVDENTAGVYDTVYADIDNDYDFTDEMAMTKNSPVSYQDVGGDGYADISGGIIYFIGDGVTNIPFADVLYNPAYVIPPGNGDLVAFHGALDLNQDHGTLCASNVVGQHVINGGAPSFRDLPGGTGGMVWGNAPNAGLVGISNIYYDYDSSRIDAYIFSVYGYDGELNSGDELQATSNSYGSSDIDNDGWDYYGRYVSRRQRLYSPSTSFLFSTGNGAPGYGTVAPPAHADTIIGIGASTHMGSTGWDSITDTNQIMFNDIATWSNRGPGASGGVGVHVAADGAYAAGAEPLNQFGFDGWNSWTTWGGTSRSAPVALGVMALVYDAYMEKHGEWPTYDVARAIFMASANDTHNDVFVQGAGTVNADRATDVAAGLYGVYTMPDVWRVGDYRGDEMGGFANIISAGETDTQTFTVTNDSAVTITVDIADDLLARYDSYTLDFVSELTATEEYTPGATYYFDAPNYLIDLSSIVSDTVLQDADMMNVRLWFDYDQFDLDANPANGSDNRWRLIVYNWKDINGDTNLWTDDDSDGVVDFMPMPADGSGNEIEPGGELDQYEYGRFAYLHNNANNVEVRVKQPYDRRHDGIFIGLQHTTVSAEVPTTTLHLQIDLYEHSDWGWLDTSVTTLEVPADGSAAFEATLDVPADAKVGMYEGAITIGDPGDATHDEHNSVLPVVVAVAASGTDFTFGGTDAVNDDLPYDNGQVRGGNDWGWRAESGDWRFYFTDIPSGTVSAGTQLYVDTVWENTPTDVDTIVMGPTLDRFTDPSNSYYEPDYYGDYTLDTVGKSENKYLGSGRWGFHTATGGAREIVVAPAQDGLHLIALHNVNFGGKSLSEVVTGTVGTMATQPVAWTHNTTITQGSQEFSFQASMDLAGIKVEGFGLGKPETYLDLEVGQDDPNDPSSASYTHTLTINHGGSLEVATLEYEGNDLDLFLLYDANDDDVFDWDTELIGSSTTPTGDEYVGVTMPDDGDYLIAVQGWAVTAPPGHFDLHITAVQGNDLQVTGVPTGSIAASTEVTFTVAFDKADMTPGSWYGMMLMGPDVAPGAIQIPVTINYEYPYDVYLPLVMRNS